MSNKEIVTNAPEKSVGIQSKLHDENETPTLGLSVLSTLLKVEEDTPENSLLIHAQRLNNVAHSFIEERESKYLTNDMESMTTSPSDFSIEAVCKLSFEARECIKLSMDMKKQKVQNFKTVMEAIRGR